MSDTERFAYTSAPERRDRIVKCVVEQGYCTITELSVLLGVSEMTIRRDSSRLVKDGRLRGFRGGVGSLSPQEMVGRDYTDRDVAMDEAKRAIGRRACAMITRDSVIAIDAGTTATRLAMMLPDDQKLHVVTNSFPVLGALVASSEIEVSCLGGLLHQESLSFAGSSTLAAISNLHIETLFLAASGLNERGAFCRTGFDAITKRALIEVSDQVVLIADSSKFASTAMVKICGWDAIDAMIVDDKVTDENVALLEQNGVEVLIADADPAAAEPEDVA